MKIYSKYIYGYLLFVTVLLSQLFISVALGWSFFELGVTTTIIANIIGGFVGYLIGLGYLLVAYKIFAQDFTSPHFHFYLWSFCYGFVAGLSSSGYAPYMPNAIWLDGLLNGTLFRMFVPVLILTAIYVFIEIKLLEKKRSADPERQTAPDSD